MKKIIILFLIFVLGCSKPSDCIESAGNEVTKEYSVANFDKIKVYKGLNLIITQGKTQKIEVKTGENLIDNIEIKIEDGFLILKDNSSCNWVREYGQTKIFVTTPTLTDIICKTEKTISSNGILTFPILRLNATDLSDGAATGDFNLKIDNNQLVIESNNVANFYISGKTKDFLASFYEGNGRIEAANLLADSINVFHRGSNDMVLNPQIKMTGKMVSTGNIICKNPNVINEVVSLFQGQVLFN